MNKEEFEKHLEDYRKAKADYESVSKKYFSLTDDHELLDRYCRVYDDAKLRFHACAVNFADSIDQFWEEYNVWVWLWRPKRWRPKRREANESGTDAGSSDLDQ